MDLDPPSPEIDELLVQLVNVARDEVFIARVTQAENGNTDPAHYTLVYANEAYRRRFGYTSALRGFLLKDMIPPNRQAELFTRMAQAVFTGRSELFMETIIHPDTGEDGHYSTQYLLLTNKQGVQYLAGISKNITHLNKQLQDLYELSENYRHMVLSSSNSILYLRPDQTIILTNKTAQENLQMRTGQTYLPGRHISEYVSAEDYNENLPFFQQMEAQLSMVVHEQRVPYPGGDRWFVRKYFPTFSSAGKYNGFVISSAEVTAEKQHIMRIEEQRKALRSIAQVQSHEVRRPLANILSLLMLMQEDEVSMQHVQPEFAQHMQLLQQSVQQLDEVIKSIVAKT